MGQRYKAIMPKRHPLPNIWLISDARNDPVLEQSLRALPRGSGFIYRHYHLDGPERWRRFQQLKRICKSRGHTVMLADSAQTAREWGADGIYGAPLSLYPKRSGMIQLATAHNLRELGQAARKSADAVLLSPVFPTNSHPNGKTLGPVRFRTLTQQSPIPVIALGGMSETRAKALAWPRWAAIDGLS